MGNTKIHYKPDVLRQVIESKLTKIDPHYQKELLEKEEAKAKKEELILRYEEAGCNLSNLAKDIDEAIAIKREELKQSKKAIKEKYTALWKKVSLTVKLLYRISFNYYLMDKVSEEEMRIIKSDDLSSKDKLDIGRRCGDSFRDKFKVIVDLYPRQNPLYSYEYSFFEYEASCSLGRLVLQGLTVPEPPSLFQNHIEVLEHNLEVLDDRAEYVTVSDSLMESLQFNLEE